jgi:hypothetical protein
MLVVMRNSINRSMLGNAYVEFTVPLTPVLGFFRDSVCDAFNLISRIRLHITIIFLGYVLTQSIYDIAIRG